MVKFRFTTLSDISVRKHRVGNGFVHCGLINHGSELGIISGVVPVSFPFDQEVVSSNRGASFCNVWLNEAQALTELRKEIDPAITITILRTVAQQFQLVEHRNLVFAGPNAFNTQLNLASLRVGRFIISWCYPKRFSQMSAHNIAARVLSHPMINHVQIGPNITLYINFLKRNKISGLKRIPFARRSHCMQIKKGLDNHANPLRDFNNSARKNQISWELVRYISQRSSKLLEKFVKKGGI